MVIIDSKYSYIIGCWYYCDLDEVDDIDWWCFTNEVNMLKKVVYMTYILDT